MADNGTAAAGPTIAWDDIGGVAYQRVKLTFGVDGVATDVSTSNKLPVDVGTVPVTGTFYQATQPVSIATAVPVTDNGGSLTVDGTVTANAGTGTFAISAASLPLPTGAATETTLSAINAKFSALGQTTMAASAPVVIASNQSAIPVSGTFWQTTQPVSIAGNQAVNNAQVGGTNVSTGNGVVGAGVQRVAIASDNTAFTVNAAQSGTWNVGTLTSITNAVTITPPTLTKGTQGATGFSTQDLKDAGRTIVNAATAIAGVACVTTEALLALNISRDGAATASATTHAVTSGKRWRITGLVASARSSAATVLSARVSLRMNPSGAATATSPIIAIASMTQQAAALAEAGDTCVIPLDLEISGTMQVGLSQVCSGTGGVVYASLLGYEY